MEDRIASPSELVKRFDWPDYVVFGGMLAISAGIGIFYGCFGGKQKTVSEFLMANRSMSTFPMAMSLIASFISAITILGTPAEMYNYGTQYWMVGLCYFMVVPATIYIYMPVFYNLQLTSAYEYLNLRFHSSVRLFGSLLFILQMILYLPVVVYAPSLAMSQVTGVNVYIVVSAVFLVCVFYTTLGGMKAVIWTDTFQVIVMFFSMLVVVIKGTIDEGGASVVWERNLLSGRIEFFNFDPNPTTRHTVWTLVFGGFFFWMANYGVNQAQVQRYLTVPKVQQARTALWINNFGLVAILSICAYAGLIVYSKYHDCDPLSTKMVQAADQLFPLFVMDTLGNIPGLPGLFVSGVFSAALSTVSTGLNSLSAITLEDFVKGSCGKKLTDSRAALVSRVLAVTYGLFCFALVFAVEHLGGVLQAAFTVNGVASGPLLGLFTLGMFFPWANTYGALVGGVSGVILVAWIGVGAQVAKAYGQLAPPPKLPVSISGCSYNMTRAIMPKVLSTEYTALPLYNLSYLWYAATGVLTCLVVGLAVSFVTGPHKVEEIDPDLLAPFVNWLLRRFYKGKNYPKTKSSNSIELNLNEKNPSSQAVGVENPALVTEDETSKN